MTVAIDRIDHIVLTVVDVDAGSAFYARVLGMQPITFAGGRRGLAFGRQKINLHQAGREHAPRAAEARPGSGDFCLITETPMERVVAHLEAEGVAVEEGPVAKSGAVGPITSIYFRDPDGNLIEVSIYD